MDDKMLNYILTRKCLMDLDTAKKALSGQALINRRQKRINLLSGICIAACVSNISNLIKVAKVQSAKIKELEAKVNGDKQKGE